MIWIIALLCLGLVGLTGYYQGAVRVAASFIGLLVAALLATPLSPLFAKLLPVLGVKHFVWLKVLPAVLAFVFILVIFKIIGHTLHRKLTVHYKYKVEERVFFRWERMYKRLGLCLGLANGAVYFFVLMLPIYVAGYFTTQIASGQEDPTGLKMINSIRAQIHSTKIDRVLAAYDPAPADYYRAADIIALVKQNRVLNYRLAHYPVFLTLGERAEFQDLAKDVQFQELFAKPDSTVADIIKYPKVQQILTNSQMTADIASLIGNDLKDLQDYLKTGKSEKYDSERIIGYWTINQGATLTQARKKMQNPTPKQWNAVKLAMIPTIADMTLTVTTDNKAILKVEKPGADTKILSQGTWNKENDLYKVSLPGGQASACEVDFEGDQQLSLVRDGVTYVFSKGE